VGCGDRRSIALIRVRPGEIEVILVAPRFPTLQIHRRGTGRCVVYANGEGPGIARIPGRILDVEN